MDSNSIKLVLTGLRNKQLNSLTLKVKNKKGISPDTIIQVESVRRPGVYGREKEEVAWLGGKSKGMQYSQRIQIWKGNRKQL